MPQYQNDLQQSPGDEAAAAAAAEEEEEEEGDDDDEGSRASWLEIFCVPTSFKEIKANQRKKRRIRTNEGVQKRPY